MTRSVPQPFAPPTVEAESEFTDAQIKRGLRRMRNGEIDFNHDHAALQAGEYSKTQYNNRYQAEMALVNDYRFYFRDDQAAVDRALEFTYERSAVTDWGIRASMEDSAFYRQLFGEATAPENLRDEGDWTEVNRKQNETTKAEIRRAVDDDFEVAFLSAPEAEVYFDPGDIADSIERTKKTVMKHMREMSEFREMHDPRQEGRGRPRTVFEYDPGQQPEDSKRLVTDGGTNSWDTDLKESGWAWDSPDTVQNHPDERYHRDVLIHFPANSDKAVVQSDVREVTEALLFHDSVEFKRATSVGGSDEHGNPQYLRHEDINSATEAKQIVSYMGSVAIEDLPEVTTAIAESVSD